MKTRTLHAETGFILCPNTSISDTLKKFGTSGSDTAALLALTEDKEKSVWLEEIISQVEDQWISLAKLAKIMENIGTSLDGITCRMKNQIKIKIEKQILVKIRGEKSETRELEGKTENRKPLGANLEVLPNPPCL